MTIASSPMFRQAPSHRQKGFTLIELSISLLVIGLLLGAVAIGRDLQRSAANQRLSTDFVQGWQLAYEAYLNGVGRPPGDDLLNPTGRVNGAAAPAEFCGADMINAFLAAGVRLPEGRANGMPDRAVYLDSNGNPQEVRVCFQSVAWAEPGASVGVFELRRRNAMVLTGTTYALAAMLDQQIDGRNDARFGRLRDTLFANDTTLNATSQIWPIDERIRFGQTTATANAADISRDEDQIAVTTAIFQMTR